jgi:CBS domain-containing protein
MKVKSVMTPDPACCTPATPLREVAQMMATHDCGEIPVVESLGSGKPLGVVTDRDIVIRTLAKGRNPMDLAAGDCMSSPAACVTESASLSEAVDLMESRQLRRILVVDEDGSICGIVAQADIALHGRDKKTGEAVEQISKPH